MEKEALVHREMCLGHVEISPKEIAAAAVSVCEPVDLSVAPPGIPTDDQ
jgi:hypothetical protein